MSKLLCRYVTSLRDVETVLYDPDIIKKLGYRPGEIRDMTYIGCYIDRKIAALLCVEEDSKGHFHCLKPYRRQAVEIAEELLRLAPHDIYFRVSSKAIENFGKKLGFKVKE